ncbi:esterase/lipase family protein [Actinokineospora fastidiosa]|uniref:AB hydrolase-1 domain-containing protein n=1 Tax=Actinokineospora fastidiosa TaxID=1816 RepID=A0A918GBX9_9PSEU|nr:alpha/beta fold hydrolase [Actinokineospora fastidiosa]GGS28755.1 hypothetical protein GCM10010171_22360 [Actinokineospora fastidiosa]
MNRGALLPVLCLVGALCAAPARAQDVPAQCDLTTSTKAEAGQDEDKRPVVFVHGWTGGPLIDSANALSDALDGKISTYAFDYSKVSSHWASDSRIAPCLAAYLGQVSAAHRGVGGDGRLIVVAHSMGGLALRYALTPELAEKVPYVITFGTPMLGSPWGGADGPSRLVEVFQQAFGKDLPDAAGRDGGKCLAEHTKGAPLPDGCGDLPPWLPEGVTLTQIGGDATVDRTFFGFKAYSIPLAGDGVVPLPSAHGYPLSGPGGQPPLDGAKSYSRRSTCSIDFGLVNRAAHELAFVPGAMALDYLTLQDIQQDRFSLPVQAYLGGVTIAASCSHTRLTTERKSVDHAVAVIKEALTALAAPAGGTATTVTNVVALDKAGNPAAGWAVENDGTELDECHPSPAAVGADIGWCGSTAAGALVCWVKADRHSLLCGDFPWNKRLRAMVSTKAVPALAPPQTADPWGLELESGAKCLLRNGGSWPGRADEYVGAYSCDDESVFVLVGNDRVPVDRSGAAWTVKVGGLSATNEALPPPTTERVRTAYFAAAP